MLLGAVWGASFLFIKLSLESFAPATIVALRIAGGAVLLNLVLYQQGHQLPITLRAWIDMFLVGIVGMVIPFFLIGWGEQHISSSLAAILVATTPLFTLLIVYLWTREESLGLLRTTGVLLGFVGVGVALQIYQLDLASASTQGQFAVLGASLCYGVSATYARQVFRGMPAMVPAAGTMIGGALCITPVSLLIDGVPTFTPTSTALVGIVGLTLLSTVMAYILYYWTLERIGPARTTMVTYLIPIFALVYGWLWLRESIGVHTLLGLVLVLAGIMVANSTFARKQQAAKLAP